jgi:DNA-directed RNA polymerase specialized sigma24 family protein
MSQLKRISQLRSIGLVEADGKDLLQEAISRALAGERKWPRDVPLVAFLAQTIRSIANDCWRRSRVALVDPQSDGDSAELVIDGVADNHFDPEREVAARLAIERVEKIFSDDTTALAIIYGLGEGQSPAEIQLEAGINKTEYATAQRRIRRRIAKALEEKEL